MNKILLVLRNSIYLLFLVAVLTNCNPPEEKTIHARHIIEIKEMRFQPASLSVHAGDTVIWMNRDFVDHDITEEIKKEWSSSRLIPGKSWSFVVTKNVSYYCNIHQVMKGKLIVE